MIYCCVPSFLGAGGWRGTDEEEDAFRQWIRTHRVNINVRQVFPGEGEADEFKEEEGEGEGDR